MSEPGTSPGCGSEAIGSCGNRDAAALDFVNLSETSLDDDDDDDDDDDSESFIHYPMVRRERFGAFGVSVFPIEIHYEMWSQGATWSFPSIY